MEDDQQCLLCPEPSVMLKTATSKSKKKSKKSRGLLPSVRFRSSSVFRALRGCTSRLRYRIKPAFKLVLCKRKRCKSKSTTYTNDPLLRSRTQSVDADSKHHNTKAQLTTGRSKKHGDHDHHRKQHIQAWQHRVNGALASLVSHKDSGPPDVPKGCIGVYVGKEHSRFVVPIPYLNHPLFASLLERVDDVEGCFSPGPLWIPCDVVEFETRQFLLKHLSKNGHRQHLY